MNENSLIKETIAWQDFEKLDIRTGTIISAENFPEAKKPAYQINVDFGVLGIKKTSAQITSLYKKKDLIGLQILAVVNFPKKQIANFLSEFLILGIYGENNEVTLIHPGLKIENGSKVG